MNATELLQTRGAKNAPSMREYQRTFSAMRELQERVWQTGEPVFLTDTMFMDHELGLALDCRRVIGGQDTQFAFLAALANQQITLVGKSKDSERLYEHLMFVAANSESLVFNSNRSADDPHNFFLFFSNELGDEFVPEIIRVLKMFNEHTGGTWPHRITAKAVIVAASVFPPGYLPAQEEAIVALGAIDTGKPIVLPEIESLYGFARLPERRQAHLRAEYARIKGALDR